ncbi:hypothetical protein E6H33_01330 [Candidatus Bathyarchaeota archaeon]|nr:MAG: hypothetical protein E6H33_01330 [Candidatus Bathyarchaeota archaeon]
MTAKRLRSLLVFALLTLSLAPTVLAHADSPLTHTSVVGQPDFSLNAFPGNTLTIPANGDRYMEDVGVNSVYSFSGNVSMLATSNSTALYAQLGLEVVKVAPGSGVYVNITFSSFTVGAYSVNVTGMSGSLVRSVAFQILVMTPSVGDFAITASQQSLSMLPGNSTTVSVWITSIDNFSGPVYVNAFVYASDTYTLNDPFALQAIMNTNQVSMPKNQTIVDALTLQTPNLPIHGIYTVKIDATGGLPTLYHSLNLTASVLNVDFTLKMNPDSLSTDSGTEANSTITVRSYGFIGTVDFAFSVSPAGINCTLSKPSTPVGAGYGPSGNSTLSCRGSPGTYTVTITGKSGSLSRSAMMTMNVEGSTPKPPQTAGFMLFGLSPIESSAVVAGTIALLALTGIGIYSLRKRGPTPTAN